jgi:2-C-methyl-D-erythritol 4-phosphate cytidylyltransferase/2-C-methyl-D-erythritol 4-phosphate cytidylyltransferase/2-C-methyl-D-erythritol 2,4-cyclodiphosphate synthase
MWAAQTPQGFRKDLLVRAHEAARRSSFLGTDEASLIERLGIGVRIVEGSERNVKITTPGDRRLAEFLLKSTKRRRPAR